MAVQFRAVSGERSADCGFEGEWGIPKGDFA